MNFFRQKLFSEKNLHTAFDVSLILKGIHSVIEIVSGTTLFFISQDYIVQTLYSVTQEELNEDPRDFIANSILASAQHLTTGSQHFAAFYLLSHGILKTFLVANLFRGKLWSYPLAMIIFGGFIVYQLFRFNFTHSTTLLIFTALDIIVILLTWHEYNFKRKRLA